MVYRNITNMYDISPPPLRSEAIKIGDKDRLKFEYIGNIDIVFRDYTDERTTLFDALYVPGLGFNLYSLHAVQRANMVVSDALGAYVFGTNVTFPRNTSRSYLRASGFPTRTVGAERKAERLSAIDRLRQL